MTTSRSEGFKFNPVVMGSNWEDRTIDILVGGTVYVYHFNGSVEEILGTYKMMERHSRGKAFGWLKKQAVRFESHAVPAAGP